eukprot:1454278-Rhodomonas_salina.1
MLWDVGTTYKVHDGVLGSAGILWAGLGYRATRVPAGFGAGSGGSAGFYTEYPGTARLQMKFRSNAAQKREG